MAFEVQLSTTFLRVIAERRVFYEQEGGMLLWVFKSFDEERARLTQDDVFYNNNRNLFLASEDTLLASKKMGRFCLECRWEEPYIEDAQIRTRWAGQIVSIDDLKLDSKRQRVYFFNYDSKAEELANACLVNQATVLREKFESYWLGQTPHSFERGPEWSALRKGFASLGLSLPYYPEDGRGPVHLLNALYSAKYGRVVGWNYKKFIEVAHHIAGRYKGFLWAYRQALAVYGRKGQILEEDESSKWRKKVEHYRPLMEAGDKTYKPDSRFDELIAFLFPELASKLGGYPAEQLRG